MDYATIDTRWLKVISCVSSSYFHQNYNNLINILLMIGKRRAVTHTVKINISPIYLQSFKTHTYSLFS